MEIETPSTDPITGHSGSFAIRRPAGWGLALADRKLLSLAGDALAAVAAALVGLWLWTFTSGHRFGWDYLLNDRLLWLVTPPSVWMALYSAQYSVRRAMDFGATARSLIGMAGLAFGLYLILYFFLPRNALPRLYVLYFIALTTAGQLAWRWLYIAVLAREPFRRRTVVVGDGWKAQAVLAALAEHCAQQYEIVGTIADTPSRRDPRTAEAGPPAQGGHLLDTVRAWDASEIILANCGDISGVAFQALLDCQAEGIAVTPMPSLYERVTGRLPIAHVEADWMVSSFIDQVRLERWFQGVKRAIDIMGAVTGLMGLGLLFPFVAAAVLLESGRPIFFRQKRLGRGGRPFVMYKFRTMRPDAEGDGNARWASLDDPRVTRLGRLLRRTRLDETPQFWNVLKGEMSLIGPRPERPEFYQTLEEQIPFYRARLLVKPGITGWAQANYRYSGSVDETAVKLQYDLYYIKHQSLWLDLTILARTVGVVVSFQGT